MPTMSNTKMTTARQPEIKMATCKPEIRCISGLDSDIEGILVATPTFFTTPDSLVTLPTSPDVGQHPEIKMATYKPEIHYISGLARDIREIPVATPTFSTTPDSIVVMPTLTDVGRQPEIKMATFKPEIHYISRRE